MQFSRIDDRLKILLGLTVFMGLAIVGYAGWFLWTTNLNREFGNPQQWPEHIDDIDGMRFRYPPTMDLIVPQDETQNPRSVVLHGERGESVLMQVGTWRPGETFTNLDEAVTRAQAATSRRTTTAREDFTVDGRNGAMVFQEEPGGRHIIEVLIYDEGSGEGAAQIRELSLQLPDTTSAKDRVRYTSAFRALVQSLHFLQGGPDFSQGDRPDDVPYGWQRYESTDGGFSLWYPFGWVVEQGEKSADGMMTFTFHPKDDTASSIVLTALPSDRTFSTEELKRDYAEPLLQDIDPATRDESGFGFPGVGVGDSIEGMSGDSTRATIIEVVTFVKTDVDQQGKSVQSSPQGRGYVLFGTFPYGMQQYTNLDAVKRMVRSLRLF